MRHHYSASKRKLGRLCLYFARGDIELPIGVTGTGAGLGSALHESADEDVSEDVFRDGWRVGADLDAIAEQWGLKPAAADQLEAMHAAWRAWWLEFVGDAPWRTEVPYAFDTATGVARELPSTGQRDYSACTDTEVPATIDGVLFEPELERVTVLDLKTGRPPKRVADYILQLAHGAVCAARVHGVDRARVVIAHVTTTDVIVDEAELDAFDLDSTASELRGELARIARAVPAPGLHCRELYCPARSVCPETLSALAEVVSEPVRRLPLTGVITSDEHAAALLEGLPRLSAWIEERWQALRSYADEHEGVRLADGRVYAGWPSKSTSLRLDVKGAEEALVDALGDRARDAIQRSLTQAGIERVARSLAKKRGDISRIKGAVIDALRRHGAVKVSTFKRYEVRAVDEREGTDVDANPIETEEGRTVCTE